MSVSKLDDEQVIRSQGLHVTSAREGERNVIRLGGELDLASVAVLRDEVSRLEAGECGDIVFDLRALQFLDSTGIHLLAEAHRRATGRGRKVSVAVADGPVRRVLKVCGMLDVLDPHEGEVAAA